MELTAPEQRVLGCLVEKGMTTPEYYPLTLNALITACNQRSNRDPVVDFDDGTVIRAIDGLRDRGLIRLVRSPGQRAVKYKQVVPDVLGIDERETALLAVLLLRGEQTPGELRARTGRYVEFNDLDEVEDALGSLGEHGFAMRLGRRPGEKESRYAHLLGGDAPAPEAGDDQGVDDGDDSGLVDRVTALEAQIAVLAAELRALRDALGA